MLENPDWRSVFAPNGELLREGDLIRRTNYSRTLHTIAEQGAEAFYSVRSPIVHPDKNADGCTRSRVAFLVH